MIKLERTLQAWETAEFESVFKDELRQLDSQHLPLQAGLTQSSHVSDSDVDVVLLNSLNNPDSIHIRCGIFYTGIIAGSCCADDPTPVDEQPEYCELQVNIDKSTAEASISLLSDNASGHD